MKDCWAVLGIPRTRDTEAVKKAYRDLIKKYHPDTVRPPEMVRHYTIKCVRINDAFEQALDYCDSDADETTFDSQQFQERTVVEKTVQNASTHNRSPLARWIISKESLLPQWLVGLAYLVVGVLLSVGVPLGFIYLVSIFGKWMTSLPFASPTRMVFSGVVVIPIGMIFGSFLCMFTSFPAYCIWKLLDMTPLSRYSIKVAGLSIAIGNALVVYYGGYHWPFEHRSNEYYTILYHVCRFIAWAPLPLYGLCLWIKEYYQYRKVEPHFGNCLAVIENNRY